MIGDMLELGTEEEKSHQEMLLLALSLDLDLVATAGPRFQAAAQALNLSVLSGQNALELANHIRPLLLRGDILLLKGSRGLAMEKIIPALAMEN